MSPISVLGKRAGPSEEDAMLDALRNLSATPYSKSRNNSDRHNHLDKASKSLDSNMSYNNCARNLTDSPHSGISAGGHNTDQKALNQLGNLINPNSVSHYSYHKPLAHRMPPYKPHHQFKQPPPQQQHQHTSYTQPASQNLAPESAQFLAYPCQFPPQQQGKPAFLPQSPPQEQVIVNRSPLDEFGGKRRRVSANAKAIGRRRSYGDLATNQVVQQPPTPQTPTTSNYALMQGAPIPQRSVLNMQTLVSPPQSVPLYPPAGVVPALGPSAPSAPIMQKAHADNIALATRGGYVNIVSPPNAEVFQNIVPTMAPGGRSVPGYLRPRWKPTEVQLTRIVDGRISPEMESDYDDEGGHYIIKVGERFAWRYLIIKLLGQGTFGKVVQVWDERTQKYCAIKIIRAIPKYRDASKIELRVLSMLRNVDPHGHSRCVRMLDCFDYRNHVCIVTDLHDISVYDFLHDNSFVPFPGHHIACFAKQILTSVAHIHSLGLIHTDLKPENVLLSSSLSQPGLYKGSCKASSSRSKSSKKSKTRQELQCTDVTLIDFGSAVFEDEYHPSVVSTRHYRAPEVIFGTGWSYACDLWSMGCLLVELCTGRVLFETRDDIEHLHMMQRTLQISFDKQLLNEASKNTTGSKLVTSSKPQALMPVANQQRKDSVERMRTLEDLVQAYAPYKAEKEFWDGFLDLIYRLMEPDPKHRIMASEALQHPWITSYT